MFIVYLTITALALFAFASGYLFASRAYAQEASASPEVVSPTDSVSPDWHQSPSPTPVCRNGGEASLNPDWKVTPTCSPTPTPENKCDDLRDCLHKPECKEKFTQWCKENRHECENRLEKCGVSECIINPNYEQCENKCDELKECLKHKECRENFQEQCKENHQTLKKCEERLERCGLACRLYPNKPECQNTPTPTLTQTPGPSETPGPGPSATPGPGGGGGGGGGGSSGGGGGGGESPSNSNPLVAGIVKTNGQVLGVSTLPKGGVKGQESSEKLPSSNQIIEDSRVVIPKLNLEKQLYRGAVAGDQWVLGDKEVLETTRENTTVLYGHNSLDTFGSLAHLRPGDTVEKNENGMKNVYRVLSVSTVSQNDINVFTSTDKNSLLLITCDLHDLTLRTVVKAQLVQN